MNKAILAGVVIVIVILSIAGYMAYTSYVPGNHTDLGTNQNQWGGGSTGNTGGGNTGGNTGSTSGGSATLWQSLYITDTSGSYWVNPPQPFNLNSIFGTHDGTTTQVNRMQNSIYMSIPSTTGTVQSWTFSCTETIILTDMSNNVIGTLVQPTTVNAQGQSVNAGSNTCVTSASITGAQLQTLLGTVVPATSGIQYYFTIELSNIQLNLTLSGGQTMSLSATGQDNVLQWQITVQ